ncbi:hypothetical protein Verru16b_02901 [Lacunisphaera limnophila]|uniref:Fibronectin type-III domain-containing protein n=1 Tax=Lacunisphaera limnophila TaxID=1838286 RepID=A0A1D8AY50_9BACT|nr:hypothetical protein [Lacunisphaera limnophila]AOS45812.1 hypothetical protein Verru16b_02901 [Lacunisphaera limnophila]
MKFPFRSPTAPALALFALLGVTLPADPLTKEQDLDFGRDVASRHLRGLAARSDGRLLSGPVFTDLTGPKIGDILWNLKPAGPNRFVVGTSPEGKVQEITFNPKDDTYTVREVADVEETHAISLLVLPDEVLLVGTSPVAALYLVKEGKAIARVPLPADSVFDLLALPDGSVLAATGNPGKIYKIDLAKLAAAGLLEGKIENDALLADRGVTVFGEIRDRNVRRLARLSDGAIVAGSSPKGNIYRFPATGGAPLFLQENRDAEVVDLLPGDDGSFHAALVFTPGDALRLAAKPPESKDELRPDRDPKPAFAGRSTVVRFPANGFPETIMGKAAISFYRLARQGDRLLLIAGEQGDAFGYDPAARRSLTFAGSSSAQLNDLAPLGDGRFLLLRNNAPGLALLAFNGTSDRSLETKRLDLGQPGDLGAVRFPRLRGVAPEAIKLEISTNYGNDELEGWSPWTTLSRRDEGFTAEGLRGRYVRYRLTLPGNLPADFQIDKAVQYHRPQNRRPSLTDFRVFPPNQAIVPAAEPPVNVVSTLAQLLFPNQRDGKDDAPGPRRGSFLNSQVIPQTGVQLIYWNVTDPDGDTLAYTFSIRPDGPGDWTDLAVQTENTFLQFETGALPEGLYLTRLTVAEQAPRPAAQRLSYEFETDNLLIDRTPPVITGTQVERNGAALQVTVSGRDALALLEGAEFVLNNGERAIVLHPLDGLLDSREESFRVEFPATATANATSLEVTLYDQTGNATASRLPLK